MYTCYSATRGSLNFAVARRSRFNQLDGRTFGRSTCSACTPFAGAASAGRTTTDAAHAAARSMDAIFLMLVFVRREFSRQTLDVINHPLLTRQNTQTRNISLKYGHSPIVSTFSVVTPIPREAPIAVLHQVRPRALSFHPVPLDERITSNLSSAPPL